MPPRPSPALLVLPLLLACASTRPAPSPPAQAPTASCTELSGSWEGAFPIQGRRADGSTGTDELTIRLTFAGEQARLFSVEQGTWVEVKPGAFTARCLGPSAVVEAIDTGSDSDGRWFETWALAVTAMGRAEALARWVRLVNNVDVPPATPHSTFSYEGVGVLRRVPTPEGCQARTVNDNTTVGDFLSDGCACGDAVACASLAILLEREGVDANPSRARLLRQRACDLGHRPSCTPER